MPYHKKLIEVALPLEAINIASSKEKSIRQGHPSSLHLWWSRKPLATCRAVLFASIIDDPSSRPEEFPTEEAQEQERQRLFSIIERLVLWENTNNEEVLNEARQEILKATDGHPPPVFDPFCGGGSIPLEAQRLGLEAYASDLNPVAVLITKALIEIPPKFAGQPPVNPEDRKKMQKKIQGRDWPGASGLAEDVRYYGKLMRDEAEKRIGHLYPKAKLPDGSESPVIAWLWARTVKCPNPACGALMPLLSAFILSSKNGKESYLIPEIKGKSVSFSVNSKPPAGIVDPKIGLKRGISGIFKCIFCGNVTTRDYVSMEGKANRIGVMQTAVVAKGRTGRIYLPADSSPLPENIPKSDTTGLEFELSPNPRDVWCRNFGLNTPADLFTARQLVTLTTFSDLVDEVRETAYLDARASLDCTNSGQDGCNKWAHEYADALATYLGIAVSRSANTLCSLAVWSQSREQSVNVFSRQALPMSWGFPEVNPFANAAGDFGLTTESMSKVISKTPSSVSASTTQQDAVTKPNYLPKFICSTDPPYYDNISYADVSDFFYPWLRRSLKRYYPNLFSTLSSPKEHELVVTSYRFEGDKDASRRFFEEGLGKSFSNLRQVVDENYPTTIYYAFKQSESLEDNDSAISSKSNVASTGWETMLNGLIQAGFQIIGTWPMRTERPTGVKISINALASSIVLVCRPRPENAPIGTRKEFIGAMKRELPESLRQLQKVNIAPVDLAQAAIGPGMAIFSRYSKVLEADGTPMRVRTALQLINQHLDEYFTEQEGEYDPDTRWALSWFEQYGMNEGPFGDAETLSKAKNTSVQGMIEAGILKAGGGKARLLRQDEMDPSWDPATDRRLTVWEATQYLIGALEAHGEAGAAELQQKLGGYAQNARDLAYRLYSICERQGWAQEALAYNSLVIVWPRLSELHKEHEAQRDLESFNKKT